MRKLGDTYIFPISIGVLFLCQLLDNVLETLIGAQQQVPNLVIGSEALNELHGLFASTNSGDDKNSGRPAVFPEILALLRL